MRILILSGGDPPEELFFRSLLERGDYLIAADRGAEFLKAHGIVPDLLVGDFDSITQETLTWMEERTTVVRYDAVKDFTDTEAAVEEALARSPLELHLFGCTGHRLDHFLGNLGLLARALEQGIPAFLWDRHNKIFLMDQGGTIAKDFGDYVSFQGFRGTVEGLALTGAAYPLEDYDLVMGDPRTVSNQFRGSTMDIGFRRGTLLVVQSKDAVEGGAE